DFFYARSDFLSTGKWNYAGARSRDATLRPRHAPFDAGILSTPAWMVRTDSYRIIARGLWEEYLCAPLPSRNVTPEGILGAMHVTNELGRFRDTVRIELTNARGCEDCHKILEHASRAMVGYTLLQYGQHYTPQNAFNGTIKFYAGDVSNPRAEGPA